MVLSKAFAMVEQLGKVADNLTEADQIQLRAFIDDYKSKCVAVDIAEQLFIGKVDTKFLGDNSFEGTDARHYPKDKYRDYWILRERFNKHD